uniref:NADH dehydrogenase [ubiquinone] 1 alpha subcomplex assembly factor 3 n=1 Tax=Phlebotomus papatasi TaxID=29031 RepID=A0A1B0D502_PHLPP
MNIFGREILKASFWCAPRAPKKFPGIINGHSYEGDGKTTVQILNREVEQGLMINAFSQIGFRLNNRMNIIGPMAIFPRIALSWNVGSYEDINEKTLSLFTVLEPKIDILVVGVGDEKITPQFSRRIIDFIRSSRINVEVLNTEQACSTFNFLNSEGRVVAGAMIPPRTIRVGDHDRFISGKPILNKISYLDDK